MNILDFNKEEKMVIHGMSNYIEILQILERNNAEYDETKKIYFILSLGHSLLYRGLKHLSYKEGIETMEYNFCKIKEAIDRDLNRIRELNGTL